MMIEVISSPPDELGLIYAALLSLPDVFGDRICRKYIMEYMVGIFKRFQMATEQLGTVPVASRQDSERIRHGERGGEPKSERESWKSERAESLAQYDNLFMKFSICRSRIYRLELPI